MFDKEACERFIDSINEGSVQIDAHELETLGFRLSKDGLRRTWLTGTEVYAMVFHVTKRIKETGWSDFTAAAGLQDTTYLSSAAIPSESKVAVSHSLETKKKASTGHLTPWYFAQNNWFNTSGHIHAMNVLNIVIDVWQYETESFLSHTKKTADRFLFAELFPIDQLITPAAEYFIFGKFLNLRYQEALENGQEEILKQCGEIARQRTIDLIKNLSSITTEPYTLDHKKIRPKARTSYTSQIEQDILSDRRYLKAIESLIDSGASSYCYYSRHQLDVQGVGCPKKTGLVSYFSQMAVKWCSQIRDHSDVTVELESADTVAAISSQYFKSISGWKNAIIDRKVDATNGDTYELEEADSYSNRYIVQEMCDQNGERFCLFEDFLLKPSAKSMLIASDSGSGKTTIVRGLSALLAQAHLQRTERDSSFIEAMIPSGIDVDDCLSMLSDFYPVIISQPSFAEVERYEDVYKEITGIASNEVFLKALYSLLPSGKNGFSSFAEFETIMSLGGRLIFIVDSIDEVPSPRENYIDQLAKLVREWGFGKVLITSRRLTNTENDKLKGIVSSLSPEAPIVEILPLDEQRQRDLLKKVTLRSASLEEFHCFPGAEDILGNPLALVALARYHNEREGGDALVDKAFSRVNKMLASLGSLPTADIVSKRIQEVAFRSLVADGHRFDGRIRFEDFSQLMEKAIRESDTVGAQNNSYVKGLLQGVLWRSGMFKVYKDGGYDYIDFRYKSLKGWWASGYVYRKFDEELSSGPSTPFSKLAGTIECLRDLMEGTARMDEATRFAVLCSLEKIAPNESNNHLVVIDGEDELRTWMIRAISERIFLYSAYPESSGPDKSFANQLYEDASSFGFAKTIEGFCRVDTKGVNNGSN